MMLIREVAINKISFHDDDDDDESGWLKLYKNWIWLELFKKNKKNTMGLTALPGKNNPRSSCSINWSQVLFNPIVLQKCSID